MLAFGKAFHTTPIPQEPLRPDRPHTSKRTTPEQTKPSPTIRPNVYISVPFFLSVANRMETPSIQETRGRTPLGPPTRDAGGRAARLTARTARATLSLSDVPSDEAPLGRVTIKQPHLVRNLETPLRGFGLSLSVSPVSSAPHYSESPLALLASELEEPSSAHPAGLPPESRPRLSARRRQRSQGSTVRPLNILPWSAGLGQAGGMSELK